MCRMSGAIAWAAAHTWTARKLRRLRRTIAWAAAGPWAARKLRHVRRTSNLAAGRAGTVSGQLGSVPSTQTFPSGRVRTRSVECAVGAAVLAGPA